MESSTTKSNSIANIYGKAIADRAIAVVNTTETQNKDMNLFQVADYIASYDLATERLRRSGKDLTHIFLRGKGKRLYEMKKNTILKSITALASVVMFAGFCMMECHPVLGLAVIGIAAAWLIPFAYVNGVSFEEYKEEKPMAEIIVIGNNKNRKAA